ncbi:hypothetical protein BJ742DRAFT_878283 [Cladochytrium replicatum]|nr:hypothetical protein BJ742DRAFT_878283 [Cladochytrium replicatum]
MGTTVPTEARDWTELTEALLSIPSSYATIRSDLKLLRWSVCHGRPSQVDKTGSTCHLSLSTPGMDSFGRLWSYVLALTQEVLLDQQWNTLLLKQPTSPTSVLSLVYICPTNFSVGILILLRRSNQSVTDREHNNNNRTSCHRPLGSARARLPVRIGDKTKTFRSKSPNAQFWALDRAGVQAGVLADALIGGGGFPAAQLSPLPFTNGMEVQWVPVSFADCPDARSIKIDSIFIEGMFYI